ncbi:hypothetical protein [Hymenobacter cellulosilyticus]|uniref:Uncharacterized protein n=1 Tax=Hymenobacter cellulosilyticus TaxID=2932248 RepID=A0A8T9Q1M6_9BACT|nr:hypothetical protein [Hymenobacter cellulosilyticus]UOQ71384.1 hypothetical protein MUN79_22595 [Hymenobacter cellulosilyticus]
MHTRLLTYSLRLAPVLLFACQSSPASAPVAEAPVVEVQQAVASPKPVVPSVAPVEEEPEGISADSANAGYATYFVVVADTSRSYPALRSRMLGLSQQLTLSIDTMGRYFNVEKNRIIVPENDEDEMYAGEYYPRRFPSHSLSLEYLSQYKDQAGPHTLALVTGIYEQEATADSALAALGKAPGKPFKIKSNIYVGCMH